MLPFTINKKRTMGITSHIFFMYTQIPKFVTIKKGTM